MIKYFKINWILWRNSYIRDSKIPAHVFSVLAMHLIEAVATITFFNVLFSHAGTLAGWNFYQVLFLYALAEMIVRFHSAWTKHGIRSLAGEMIRMGDLDFYLTKPVNAMVLVTISKPRVFDLVTVLYHGGLAAYAAVHSGADIHFANIFWFICLLAAGVVLYYFLEILTLLPVFWLVRTFSLQFFMNRLGQFMRYPIGVFGLALRTSFFIAFPIMAVTYIPASALFYPPKPEYIIYMFGITIIFGLVTQSVWNLGAKHYGSASS